MRARGGEGVSTRRRTITICCLLSAGMLLGSLAVLQVLAPRVEAAPHGGGDGSPFALHCNSDEVLAGINLRIGRFVDSIEAVCVKFNSDGTWSGSPATRGRTGGSGGSAASQLCNSGWVVTGIH